MKSRKIMNLNYGEGGSGVKKRLRRENQENDRSKKRKNPEFASCLFQNLHSNISTQIFRNVSRYLLSTDYSLCCTTTVGGILLSVDYPSMINHANTCRLSTTSATSLDYPTHQQTLKGGHSLLMLSVNDGFSRNAVHHYDIRVVPQPPQRFPSMTKLVFPTSLERLCLGMSFRGMVEDNNNYKYESKLFFGNQTRHGTLSATSETAGAESNMTDESSEKVFPKKVILDPKKIIKKLKHNKKGSLPKTSSSPKGHTEGLIKKRPPPKSRSLPGLSTRRTSVYACSEGVVAFSQRQMQDIESIALKLMTELKSMKNIVERKFLNEAYRCRSMKNDADQVKLAIKNAERVEKTTKKWLSMMSRDCNRFCKIMRSTEDSASATESIMRKKKRKISFADEAGGVLCHVKYFENFKKNTEVAS